jgi:hypothetical protein
MKNLGTRILFLSVLTLGTALADPTGVDFPKGSKAVNYASGFATATRNLCPDGLPCQIAAAGTKVTLVISLNGCMDTLGPVAWELKKDDTGGADLFVSAIRVANKASKNMKCIVENVATQQFTLGEQYNFLRLHWVGTDVVDQVAVE